MTDSSSEFRFRNGSTILNYIHNFSATEKVIFGILVLIAGLTALIMANQVNKSLMVEVPTYGGELREGVVGLPRTINPVLAVTDVDRDLSALIYSGLTKPSTNSASSSGVVTDLAQSYTVSDDGLTYTFTLKPDVDFSDGTHMTAEDVAFTIEKIQDPALKSPRASDWSRVSVKVLAPNQIQFVLKQAYSPFISNTTIGILPKHIWKSVSDDQFIFSQYNIEPIGTGPYKLDSITRDSGGIPTVYKLTNWSEYSGTKPFLNTISFHFFADQEKALVALDSGDIDSLPSIAASDAAKLASDSAQAYTMKSATLPRIFGVFFNQSQSAVLADKNVRQALNISVDRNQIVSSALFGYGQPIAGPLPLPFGTASSSLLGKADTTGAIALLEKNGWKKNADTGIYEKKGAKNNVQALSFDIYTADTPDLKLVAEMLRKSWTAIGAQVDIKIFEPADLYQTVIRARKYDALLFGEQIGKDRDIYAFWHSSQRNAPGLNVAMYANSKVDKLLEDVRATGDENVRNSKLWDINNQIMADVPAIFLYQPDFTYAVPKSIHNISLGSVSTPSDRWNTISSWYSQTEKIWGIFR